MGEVIYLKDHPKFAARMGRVLLDTLKQKGRNATLKRGATFWVPNTDKTFWVRASNVIKGYLAHSKFKPKD